MKKPGLKGAFWPEPAEEQLLRAALLTGRAAEQAWRELEPSFDIDSVSGAGQRILPLLHQTLRARNIDHATMSRLKGLRRRTWYANQVLFGSARGLLEAFQQAGIDVMLLKGSALIPQCYEDPGLRLMADVDVLVRPERAIDAVRIAGVAGWRGPATSTTKLMRRLHAIGLKNAQGKECDLHWHLMRAFGPGDEELWEAAEKIEIAGVAALAPCPTDQLLHVCVHGARFRYGAPLRWAADATMILRVRGGEIDWDRLVRRAIRFRVVLQLRDTLRYLAGVLDAPVPREVIRRLGWVRTGRRQALAYWIDGTAVQDSTILAGLPHTIAEYAIASEGWGAGRTLTGLPQFLRDEWELDSSWEVPREALNRARQALRS